MNAFVEHHQQSIRFQYSSFDRMLLTAVVQPMQRLAFIVSYLDKCQHVPSITRGTFARSLTTITASLGSWTPVALPAQLGDRAFVLECQMARHAVWPTRPIHQADATEFSITRPPAVVRPPRNTRPRQTAVTVLSFVERM